MPFGVTKTAMKEGLLITCKKAAANVAELRSLFYELIADQTRSKLLSTVGDFHLVKPLSPVIYPEQKSAHLALFLE